MTNPVMTFSAAALRHLRQCVTAENAVGVRFEMKPDGCAGYGYVVTFPTEAEADDQCFQAEDIAVMMAAKSVALLRGVQVDFVSQSLGQKQLVFNNPQVKSECGCGLSVQISSDEAE